MQPTTNTASPSIAIVSQSLGTICPLRRLPTHNTTSRAALIYININTARGSLPMQADPCLVSTNLFIGPRGTAKLPNHRKSLRVQAGRDGSGLGGAGVFISGFVLGGVAVGTLGAIYAPQLSEALVGEQRKVLLRKLPKFIYDEEKELEKTRQKLTAKIAELNSSLDQIITDIYDGDSQKRPQRRTTDKIEASS